MSGRLATLQHAGLPVSFWQERWEKGENFWHMDAVNPDLLDNIHALEPVKKAAAAASRRPRILVPLCGATCDMAYLNNQGWHVVGIDAVEQGLRTFIAQYGEHLHNVKDVDSSVGVHIAADGLDLYGLDMFAPELTAELVGGECDAVWDRGSLVAIGVQQREPYIRKLLSLLRRSNKVNYLLSVFDYNTDSAFVAPPHRVPQDVVEKLVGQHTESIAAPVVRDGRSPQRGVEGLNRFDICTYAISVSK